MNSLPTILEDEGTALSTPITPMAMLSHAVANGASVEVLEKLMALQERWEANNARKAFDFAIAAAKAEIPVINKNRHVGFDSKKAGAARTDYRHEDLAEIARTVSPILGKHGLSYRFRTDAQPNQPVSVTCMLSHEAGHSEQNTLCAGRDDSGNKNSIQAIGSTVTYLQRYTLKAALGLASSYDDDGSAADDDDEGPISAEELAELQGFIDRSHADIAAFCKYMDVESLNLITKAQLGRAREALNAKLSAYQRGQK